MKKSETINFIVNWIKDYYNRNPIEGLIVGVSGGIDSALTSTLCALTGLQTICVSMPIKQKKEQYNRAINHITWLKKKYKNINYIDVDLTNIYTEFDNSISEKSNKNELALANSRSRLRMMTLYYYATINNYIVIGTGNKVEDFGIGFYTKYGDGGVDISPIADLMKSEVFKLAEQLNINKEIILAEPTDGLWDDERSDEDQIGATYEDIEVIMRKLNKGEDPLKFKGKSKKIYKIYKKFNESNKHKMIEIPVCKIPPELKL